MTMRLLSKKGAILTDAVAVFGYQPDERREVVERRYSFMLTLHGAMWSWMKPSLTGRGAVVVATWSLICQRHLGQD